MHQPRHGADTWLPRWSHSKHPDRMIRAKSCPPCCVPFVLTVPAGLVVTAGAFSGPNCTLTLDTANHLRTLGYELELTSEINTDSTTLMCTMGDTSSLCQQTFSIPHFSKHSVHILSTLGSLDGDTTGLTLQKALTATWDDRRRVGLLEWRTLMFGSTLNYVNYIQDRRDLLSFQEEHLQLIQCTFALSPLPAQYRAAKSYVRQSNPGCYIAMLKIEGVINDDFSDQYHLDAKIHHGKLSMVCKLFALALSRVDAPQILF